MNKGEPHENLELISLHIPKTAGTSFRNTIKFQYGNQSVFRIDLESKDGKVHPDAIPNHIKVVHGHSKYEDLVKKYQIPTDLPLITWVRNPIDRVISNYYYLKSVINGILEAEGRLNLGKRMIKNLEEYARTKPNRNVISRYIHPDNLDQFAFVGIQNHYEEDLRDLAFAMNWKRYPVFSHNKTTNKKAEIEESVREYIREQNLKDWEIYQQVLQLREKRRAELEASQDFKDFQPEIIHNPDMTLETIKKSPLIQKIWPWK